MGENPALNMRKNTIPTVGVRRSALIILLLFVLGTAASGATFTVTKTADTNDGVCDLDCSLREAVIAADTGDGDQTIDFDPVVFATSNVITLMLGHIPISRVQFPIRSITVNGPGRNLLTISGNGQSRVFFADANLRTLTIKSLAIADGAATVGGGIYAQGSILLSDVVIKGNRVVGGEEILGTVAGVGGGVLASDLTIVNSLVENNVASGLAERNASGIGGGIAVSASATIVNCVFRNNRAIGATAPPPLPGHIARPGGFAYGGAFFSFFSSKIINSTFTENSATGGDGMSVVDPGAFGGPGGTAQGGAVWSSGAAMLNLRCGIWRATRLSRIRRARTIRLRSTTSARGSQSNRPRGRAIRESGSQSIFPSLSTNRFRALKPLTLSSKALVAAFPPRR